ncbi:MAG: hypothetical protein FJ009_12130 [Chloroflexi bacterium]|nr:hypothetical protein [Chloroflexota bacterium]
MTIMVYGSCPPPPAPPTTVRPPTTVAPPQDKTGPSISNITLDLEGCQLIGRATITDPSGVSQAKFRINTGTGWGTIWMKNIGGNRWETEVGIKPPSGVANVQFGAWAMDSRLNETTADGGSKTISATGCLQ